MRFLILGPTEVWDDGRQLAIGGPQQRALLAVLLLEANRVIAADRLVAELWGDDPPPDARALLRGCVTRLRRALTADRLHTRPPGYLLEVRPGELDLHRFDTLETAARRALDTGSRPALEQAAEWLNEALQLWRGAAIEDLTPGICQAQAAQLAERRMVALSERIDADLYLGAHDRLVGELELQVRRYPLRERLWAQFMVALHGAGRPAEALAAYRKLRRIL